MVVTWVMSYDTVWVLWECCTSDYIPKGQLQWAWGVIMVGISSTSTHHSSSINWSLIFGLCWNAGQFLRNSHNIMLWMSRCKSVQVPSASLQQAWVTMPGLDFASTHHSSSIKWRVRFGLCANTAGKLLNDSRKWRWCGNRSLKFGLGWNVYRCFE
jgi:hypothetical protein